MTAFDARQGRRILLALGLAIITWRCWVVTHLDITLYLDEAQYWTWAQHMDWGYFSKPPGVAALIWLSTALFGDGLLGVKLLGMLCYPAAALAGWAIARRLYDERTAFWSAIALLTLPMFAGLGLFVSTDGLLTLFWMLALWAYLRALDSDAWGDWLLVGLFCGLGLLSKYTMLAWLGAAFLHLLAQHRARLASAKPWAAAILALLILAPNIVWNVAHDFPTLKHTAEITLEKNTGNSLAALGEFWAAQWGSFGPVLGCIFFVLLWQARQSWQDGNKRLLLWFALPLWVVVSLQAMKGGANANWAAPAFAPASIAIVAWLLEHGKKRLLVIGLSVNLLLVGLVYNWPAILGAAQIENPAKKNPFSRAMGWDDLGRQLRPVFAAHPGAVLTSPARNLMAHMGYQLRDLNPPAASWNPGGLPSDHYKLSTDLHPFVGRDLIFVSLEPPTEKLENHCASLEDLGMFTAWLDARTPRSMYVYVLHGFTGY